jgi:hypothetical protein
MDLSPQQHLQMLALAAGGGALFSLYGFFTRLRRDRLVADTPAVRIRSAAQGYVKVSGRAACAGPQAIAAPLSSRPCVWWAFEASRREQDSRGRSSWHQIDTGASVEPFLLSDEDGECLVGPVRAEITPTTTSVWYGDDGIPAGPPPRQAPPWRSGNYRYTERLLSAGDRLSVMGELRSHSELGDLNSAAATKLHEWKQDQAGLLARFDANHDGRLDAAEWEAVRAAAVKEAQAQNLSSSVARISVISQPTNGEPFLVAPLSAEALEKRERRWAMLYFAAGLVCVVACAWAIRQAATLA